MLKHFLKTNGIIKTSNIIPQYNNTVTATLTNGFFTVDKKWTVKYWNKAAEKILGIKAEDMVGNNLWEKFAGKLPLEFYTVYQRAFLKDIPVHFEEYWGEMGSWFDVITYYCDDILSVSFKSSNHPHDEYPENPIQKLKTLTELYRFVTEITNDSLWEWDFTTEEIFWIDGGHKRVFGYQIENALIPQSFWQSRIHPDDKERLMNKLNQIIATGSVNEWEDEYRFAKADGSYAFVHDRGHIIYKDGKASRMIGATQDITWRVLLQNKLEENRLSSQREITKAVLAAQEKERAEIATELQENLSQILVAINMFIQIAKTKENDRDLYLDISSSSVKDVISGMRKIYNKLVIPDIRVSDLFDNINSLIKETAILYPVRIEFFNNWINDKKLDQNLQLNIYRIIQEQLNNIIQHSGAKNAIIDLCIANNSLTLLITDDGKGCDITEKRKGSGISNIITRLELFYGKVSILSNKGEGFTLKAVIPLP